jgi:agmatine deiminase
MRISRPFFLAFFFTAICIRLSAQVNDMPHAMTAAEQKIMADYLREKHDAAIRSVPVPPPGQVRTMAEWEEIQALVITWAGQQNILREITRHAVKECKVLILTNNPDNVSGILINAGIPLDSVTFIDEPFNTIWVRDYGPWTVYKNDVDSLWIVDWIYNRPRPQDDAVPGVIAQHLNIPMYEATAAPYDWVHTGGNHLPDGMGTVFSSMLVLEENPEKTEAQIDSIAYLFLGVDQYIKFPTLPFDGIHHLDMHMRVIDEETIMFGQYPEGISDGPQIESNINYLLDEHTTSFGNKYKIIRLPMPPDQNGRYPSNNGNYRTYTNSIFLNKTILVPTYEERYDTTALRIYRENLPGYNVVGINCNSIIPSLGALHCITKTVGDDDPLLIAHPRLRDSDDETAEYPVVAYIKHRSGIAEANMYYRLSSDTLYIPVPMVLVDSASHSWAALIPPHPAGSDIQYYIQAIANNGKNQVRPIVAPEGYFRFRINGLIENQPPTVTITHPLDGSVFTIDQTTIPIEFDAGDTDGEIEDAVIYVNGEIVTTLDTLPYSFDWFNNTEGEFTIVIQVTDDDGSVAFSDTVTITIEGTTDTEEGQGASALSIFPNPAEDLVWIKCDECTNEISSVEICNALGQVLPLKLDKQYDQTSIDLGNMVSGMYILRVRIGEEVGVFRLIKNRG